MADEHLMMAGAAREASWNQNQQLDAALTYIENQQCGEAFEDFLRRRVEEEATGQDAEMVSVPEHLESHNQCPYTDCRSCEVGFGATEFEQEGRWITQEGKCQDCGRTWIDWYRLDGHTRTMPGANSEQEG